MCKRGSGLGIARVAVACPVRGDVEAFAALVGAAYRVVAVFNFEGVIATSWQEGKGESGQSRTWRPGAGRR